VPAKAVVSSNWSLGDIHPLIFIDEGVVFVVDGTVGQVLERRRKGGTIYALRFRAYGERRYLTLGGEAEGWTRSRAEDELRRVLTDVERGLWVPPLRSPRPRAPRDPQATTTPDFGSFATALISSREGQVAAGTFEYLRWGLAHLMPSFASWNLREVDIEAVDLYREHKVRESEARRCAIERGMPYRDASGRVLRPLSASSINKTIDVLHWVLSVAGEYGHISGNPAQGRRRRLREPPRRQAYLDAAEQIEALLEAATQLDRDPGFRCSDRRAIIATFALAGLRAEELGGLLWRHVDLANGRIRIESSKTEAGLREVDLVPLLRDTLLVHRSSARYKAPDDPVFPTRTGRCRDKDNLRFRVLAPALRRADELLIKRGRPPLPEGISPHKLRHTFASVLIACGEDPVSVTYQLGHVAPEFTLRVYGHMMRRGSSERERLRTMVDGSI
jgi:integrase